MQYALSRYHSEPVLCQYCPVLRPAVAEVVLRKLQQREQILGRLRQLDSQAGRMHRARQTPPPGLVDEQHWLRKQLTKEVGFTTQGR